MIFPISSKCITRKVFLIRKELKLAVLEALRLSEYDLVILENGSLSMCLSACDKYIRTNVNEKLMHLIS